MGDVPIAEGLSLWKDKVIWVGFPVSSYVLGVEETKRYAIELLRGFGTGERLAVTASTENLVPNENLLMLASVLENASLPLTEEGIDEIERSLHSSD